MVDKATNCKVSFFFFPSSGIYNCLWDRAKGKIPNILHGGNYHSGCMKQLASSSVCFEGHHYFGVLKAGIVVLRAVSVF